MLYPKIHSLWKREGWYFSEDIKHNPKYQAGRQSFIIGDYACPEFGNIKKWLVQEKIDGTNIRISFGKVNNDICHVNYQGRTDEAAIHEDLLTYLSTHISIDKLETVIPIYKDNTYIEITLFGEGYGAKIQKGGGNYRSSPGFILFDAYVNGKWLEQSAVEYLARKLSVPHAPIIGIMTEDEIVEYVKSKPLSLCSEVNPQTMEGIIARAEPLVLFRNGDPVKFKLKCKEFKEDIVP